MEKEKIKTKKDILGYIENRFQEIVNLKCTSLLSDQEFEIWEIKTKFDILVEYLEQL